MALSLGIIAGLVVLEIACKMLFRDVIYIPHDERNMHYAFNDTLGWFPVPHARDPMDKPDCIAVINDQYGFRAHRDLKYFGKTYLFIGDSYLWGYGVEADKTFTNILSDTYYLGNIHNLGVSGYATDQEYLLLQRYFDVFKPDVVCLVFCDDNDRWDNKTNMILGGYYKPYYQLQGDSLQLKGVPVNRSINYFAAKHPILMRPYFMQLLVHTIMSAWQDKQVYVKDPTRPLLKAMNDYTQSKGAQFVVGFTGLDSSYVEKHFCDSLGIPTLDLSTDLRFPDEGQHWTPEGHQYEAGLWYHFLRDSLHVQDTIPGVE